MSLELIGAARRAQGRRPAAAWRWPSSAADAERTREALGVAGVDEVLTVAAPTEHFEAHVARSARSRR